MPTSGDRIMKQQLAGANGAELALGTGGSEPGPGWTTERTAPVERPARWSTRVVRSARVTVHVVGGLMMTVLVFPWVAAPQRQALIQRWSRQLLRMLGVEAHVHWRHEGGLPGNVLIVANHISWLDIFVLNALQPARFIAKADLRRLPLVGRLSKTQARCSSSASGGATRTRSTARRSRRWRAATSSPYSPRARRATARAC